MTAPRFAGRFLVLLALAVGSVVIALFALELAVRLLAPGENVPMVEYDPACGWCGARNAHFVFAQRSVRMTVTHNSQGYRDVERTPANPDAAERILCCGDSFTWGWGVAQDSVYTHVLEDLFRRDGRRVEVINAGVCGRNTVQAMVDLRERGFAYRPTTVVHQVAQNDLFGNLPGSGGGLWRKPYFVLEDDGLLALHDCPVPPLSLWERVKYHAVRRSRLAYLLRYRLQARLSQEEVPRPDCSAEATPDDARSVSPGVDYSFELFCSIINRMNEECLEEGARLVVLIDFPFSQPRHDYWEEHCGEVEAWFINGYLLERAEAERARPFIPDDGHWTARAHAWIAEYLHAALAETSEASPSSL